MHIEKFLQGFENGCEFGRLLGEKGISVDFSGREKEFIESVESLSGEILVTNHEFVKDYVDGLSLFKKVFSVEREEFSEVFRIMKCLEKEEFVVGMGGGRVLDVAKMVSFQSGRGLVLIPTAPTHDGLVSRNAALIANGNKRSYPTRYPDRIVVPEYLWESSGPLKNFGKLDIIANITALEDVSLAMERIKFRPDEKYMGLSALAVRNVLEERGMKDLARALFFSGLAMEESSRYCSGSEHELEKILMPRLSRYFHGQLAGTGTLLSAKVYETCRERLPQNLFFPAGSLYREIRGIMKKQGVLEDALKPISENDLSGWLKEASSVRPERYTLWNEVDSRGLDWKKIIGEIMGEDCAG